MKDLSPAAGASRGQSGQQLQLAPADFPAPAAACLPGTCGEGSAGLGLALLGLGSPSSQQTCHPYAQDHNRISSIRPGKEAFKLLMLCWGEMTALPRIRSVGSIETNLGGSEERR